jgi:hypothetical protein
MRPIELARVGFGVPNEVSQRCPRRGLVHGDDLEPLGDPRNGCKILDWIVAGCRRYRRDNGQRAGISQQQRIAVRKGFCDFPRADCAGGARAMLNDDRLTEFRVENLRGKTGGKIRRPARRSGHDNLDRPLRIGLSVGRRSKG